MSDQFDALHSINDNPFFSYYNAIICFEINELDRFLLKSNQKVETFINQGTNKLKNSKVIAKHRPREYDVINCLKFENFDEINFIDAFVSFIKKDYEKSMIKFTEYEKQGSLDTRKPIKQYFKLIAFNSLIEKDKLTARTMTAFNKIIEDLIKKCYETPENLKENLENISNNYPKQLKYFYIGNIYFYLKDFKKAQTNFDKFINYSKLLKFESKYDIEPIKLKIGICLHECKKYDISLRYLNEIEGDSLKELIFYHNARNFLMKKDFNKAMKSILVAIKLGEKNNFQNLVFSFFYKGMIHYEQKNYKDALEAFNQQILLQSDFGNAYVYKAYCYENSQDLKATLTNKEILKLYDQGLANNEGYDWFENRVKCFNQCKGSKSQIFISYCHDDRTIVDAVYDLFVKFGFNCWKDDAGIRTGDLLTSTLKAAIKNSKIFISFLSVPYAKSKSCNFELNFAYDLNKEPDASDNNDPPRNTGKKIHILPVIVKRPPENKNPTGPPIGKFDWLGAMNDKLKLDELTYAKLIDLNTHYSEMIKNPKIGEMLNVITKLIIPD